MWGQGGNMVRPSYFKHYYECFNEDFSVAYKETQGAGIRTFHIHDQYELLLCLSDDMFCNIDKHSYSLQTNTLLLFNNMDLHYFGPKKPNGENKRYVAFFKASYIDSLSTATVSLLDCFLFRPFSDSSILPLTLQQSQELQCHFQKILQIQSQSEDQCYGKELYLHLLLAELLLNVNTFYHQYHHIANDSRGSAHYRIYEVIQYIHENYRNDLRLDQLANHFFINKYSLWESFKAVTGVTPSQYITNCRIMKAKELLMKGEAVESVCAETGFNNVSHFSRTFKTKVGQSPKQYQKSMRV